MSATLLRHLRTRTKCKAVSSKKYFVLPKYFSSYQSLQPPVRCFSSTPCFRSRTLPGQKIKLVAQQFQESPAPEQEREDAQARAQRFLEESAAPVVVQDMEEFKDILVEHGSYETFMLMVLTRLQPILFYCLHHDPMKFLDGFAYDKSAVGRAREATIWLFISAHAWFTRAAGYNAQLLTPISPDVLRLAELFEKAGIAAEKYVEKKQGEDIPTWYELGSMILDCADQAWRILPADIGLYGDKYQDGPNADAVQSNEIGTSTTNRDDSEGEDMASSVTSPGETSEKSQSDTPSK